eukprot:8748526-Pyramimonas_sp.AAC.1
MRGLLPPTPSGTPPGGARLVPSPGEAGQRQGTSLNVKESRKSWRVLGIQGLCLSVPTSWLSVRLGVGEFLYTLRGKASRPRNKNPAKHLASVALQSTLDVRNLGCPQNH